MYNIRVIHTNRDQGNIDPKYRKLGEGGRVKGVESVVFWLVSWWKRLLEWELVMWDVLAAPCVVPAACPYQPADRAHL